MLDDYANVPTAIFHDSLLFKNEQAPSFHFGVEGFHSDSIIEGPEPYGSGSGMRILWDQLIEPRPQIFGIFTGHVTNPSPGDDFTFPRAGKPPVYGFLRNYQFVKAPGLGLPRYGAGWNVIAVFDPEASEIRVRSYRIDDTDFYADPQIDTDHDGVPAPTDCLDVDWGGFGERTIPFEFERMPVLVSTAPFGRLPLLLAVAATLLVALVALESRPERH